MTRALEPDMVLFFFFFQAEDGIRDLTVTGVQTCALPISCTPCHNNYPELNDFGEAFKKNGFKFPKDDETYVKEPPVLLGAAAQRQAFPKAIYPAEIPGAIPIGLRYSGSATFNSKQPLALGFLPRSDLFT